ncbi:aminotransferase class V-fold PLP-dependent enzyme [Litorimonas sp. WD9-15]|uniref:aminotransferase class V-fold PLP-dependent enzyme n=1 Tax=Litorimonas sp. WD9-15 TaxID=3418716 RepID=UPI003CFE2739
MRKNFHVPENYFLSHSVGCLPKVTEAALTSDFLGPWKSGASWADWMPVLDRFRHGMAQIMDVTAAEICPQINVSSALTKILHSLPPSSSRNQILLSKQDFPTIGFVVKQAELAGFELCFVEGDVLDAQRWGDAITDRTAFVHVTHSLSNTSHLLPVAEICVLAKQAGAKSVIDAAQSTGIVPVTPKDWGADFVIGTGVKFLCFGPGACFLYAAKEILPDCNPVDVGWFSHENPFEMDITQFRFAANAMRFFGGTPSPAPLVAANAAIEVWSGLEAKTLHARIRENLDTLCEAVPDEALVSPKHPIARGGTCVVNPADRTLLRNNLKAADILHDERTEGFRFSVHAYTPLSDCTKLASVFKASL